MANSKPRAAWLLPLLLLAACGSPTPPEQRVRDFVATLETQAENREYTELLDHIASDYLDSRGNDKLKVAAILRGFYLRNKSVHLLVRIGNISFPAEDRASVTLHVGMARSAMSDEDTASLPRTNLHRIDMELVADGDSYEIVQTEWQRASAGDFIG